MPGPKNMQQILGRLDPPLLLEYLKRRSVELDVDPEKLPKKQPGKKLYEAMKKLEDGVVQQLEPDLFEMAVLSSELCVLSFIDSGRKVGLHIADELEPYKSEESRNLHIACHYPGLWANAKRFAEVEACANSKAWSTYPGFPYGAIHGVEDKKQVFLDQVVACYSAQDIRGKISEIDHVVHGEETDYFFIKMDAPCLHRLQVRNKKIEDAIFHPAFEIVFVHHRRTGELNLLAEGGKKITEPLRRAYSEVMHGIEPPDLREEPVPYNLDCLLNVNKQFPFDPEDGIERVFLKKLYIKPINKQTRSVMLEGDPGGSDRDLYVTAVAELKKTLSSENYVVSRAEFKITFVKGGKIPKTSLQFHVSAPRRDNFKNELLAVQALIKKLLKRWDIDATELTSSADLATNGTRRMLVTV